jgi:hypothetical protein
VELSNGPVKLTDLLAGKEKKNLNEVFCVNNIVVRI